MIDPDEAIRAHLNWTEAFRTAIVLGRPVDCRDIGRADACALGRWLTGAEAGRLAGTEAHDRLVAAHAAFHREAAKVAALITAGRAQEAQRSLWAGRGYARASRDVRAAIRALAEGG